MAKPSLMRKLFKILGLTIGVILLLIGLFASYVYFFLPGVGPAPELKVAMTPERVERGRYLANSVAVCIDCHSRRNWTIYSAPQIAGTDGGGGDVFDHKLGFPGTFYSRNITPYGLKNWTDGEIFRAITTGVSKNGKALFPVMPYHNYGRMDEEDVHAIIAYLRTMPEVKNDVPESAPDFPFSIIINTIPQKAALAKKPAATDTIAYGGYLVNVAGCRECHTPFESNKLVEEMSFAGGRVFDMPFGTMRTPNITPHASGIGSWDRQLFVQKFRMYADSGYHAVKVAPGEFNTIMPWAMYARMTEADLASIYAYLKQLKPIENSVEKFSPKQKIAQK